MADFKAPSAPVRREANTNQDDPNAQPLLYQIPFWSSVPADEFRYTLEVIHDGSVQQVIELGDKPFHLIGRAPICDIAINSDSISRQHAVIQFRKTGEAFLYDLGSTHGTFLNGGAPIAPNTYKRIMAGDGIKFGVSTRLYIFEGGPDREEVVEENPVAKLAASLEKKSSADSDAGESVKSAKSSNNKKTEAGIVVVQAKRRFGQAKGAVRDDDDEADAEKRMEAQLGRGRKARGEGRDDEEEEEDRGKVSDEERDNAELEMVAGYLGREAIEGADGDDSFYDRTSSDALKWRRGGSSHSTEPDSYETLGVKIRLLNFVINTVKTRIAQLDAIISKDSKRRSSSAATNGDEEEEEDALEAFMSGMSQTVAEEEEKAKRVNALRDLQAELSACTALSAKLKPEDGGVHVAIVSTKKLEALEDSYYRELVDRVTALSGNLNTLTTKTSLPEPKRAKLAEPPTSVAMHTMPPPAVSSSFSSSRSVEPPKPTSTNVNMPPPLTPKVESREIPPSRPTSAVSAYSDSPVPEKKRQRPETQYDDNDDDSYSTWQAPQGQTGDGKTSLNAKLGY